MLRGAGGADGIWDPVRLLEAAAGHGVQQIPPGLPGVAVPTPQRSGARRHVVTPGRDDGLGRENTGLHRRPRFAASVGPVSHGQIQELIQPVLQVVGAPVSSHDTALQVVVAKDDDRRPSTAETIAIQPDTPVLPRSCLHLSLRDVLIGQADDIL